MLQSLATFPAPLSASIPAAMNDNGPIWNEQPIDGRGQSRYTAWAITTDRGGHAVQCIGLIEALGLTPVMKSVAPPRPWRWMAPWGPAFPDRSIGPPWPELLVASGRQTVPFARAVRRRSRGKTLVTVLQSPGIDASHFDLVWVPEHDRLRGDNVVTTLTPPHRLTAARLSMAADRFAPAVVNMPRPLGAVLIGGTSSTYRFGVFEALELAKELRAFSKRHRCGLLVTASPRTGKEEMALITRELADIPALTWNCDSENPYFAYLGLADFFVVTCDSVNMLGEAAFTGKPVYAYPLPGGSRKFAMFHKSLMEHGAIRRFDGELEFWSYPRIDATQEIAAEIRRRLAMRSVQSRRPGG